MKLGSLKITEHKKPRLKVRLTCRAYQTKSGFELRKTLYFYKKPDPEFLADNFFEHASNVEGLHAIQNLHLLDDGIYELVVCDIEYDRETGWVDNWDYKLIAWRD